MQNPPEESQAPQTAPGYAPQYPTQPMPHYPPQRPTQPTPPYPPQYPQPYPSLYPSPQPMNVYFQNQSFTNKAVIAFLLYWLGYIPGLIFNVMYLIEAHRVQGETGRTPSGYGCLWATLIASILPGMLLLGLCFLIMASMMAAGGGTTTP